MSEQHPRIGTVRRGLCIASGVACVALGALGIVVPGLPTTVFLLVASYLFARSSPSLQRRLVEHPRFGPYLRMARTRRMPLRAKVISLGAMWAGVIVSCVALAGAPLVVRLAVVTLGVVGTVVLLLWVRTLPTTTGEPAISR